MRFRVPDYARAFREALASAPAAMHGELLRRFLAVVRKHGGRSRIREIARAIEALEVREGGGRWIELEFARPMGDRTLERFRTRLSERDHLDVRINPGLVAGVRITVDGEIEFDHSLKRKLDKLFVCPEYPAALLGDEWPQTNNPLLLRRRGDGGHNRT